MSTMKAESVTLAHNCLELFLITDGVSIMAKAIGLSVYNTTIQVSIKKDNFGSFPSQNFAASISFSKKHYHTKTI